ncbi:MAG: DUF3857 domain-containing protein [Candidatus Omnitrophota bacterium]
MSLKLSLRHSFFIFLSLAFAAGCLRDGGLEDFSRQYEKVSEQYRTLVDKKPNDQELRLRLAQFYYRFRDYRRLQDLLGKASGFREKVLLAKAQACLKEYGYAIETFEWLEKNFPREIDNLADGEFFYLYGDVLEEKNLFPKAIEIYGKVKDDLAKQAQERIQAIKVGVEQQTPDYIFELAGRSKGFRDKMAKEAAMIFLADEEVEVTPENTSLTKVHVIEQVLQERGKELAEVIIGYDSTYERVELEFARTISKDGRVMYAGKENIRDVSKYLNFPLYSNARALIVSMSLVDVGSFIEYKIKIYSSKLVNEDDISLSYRLRERYPVYESIFKLVVPKDKDIRYKVFNFHYAGDHSLEPVIQERDDKKIFTWRAQEVEPLIPEYNMPPSADVNPAVVISSFSSWDEIFRWWHASYQDKFNLSKETQKVVRGLIKEDMGYLDKAKKMYEFCAQNIRYVGVEYGESGYQPHSAEEVFMNRYGDCKDQAILLTAMMRLVGIKAYPVLIPTRKVIDADKEFPSINFNHAICVVEHEGDFIFLDPTAETTSFLDLPLSDQARTVMVFLKDSWKIMRTPELRENATIYDMAVELDEEGNAVITRTVTTKGFYTSAHRGYLKYTHPSKIKEDIQKKMVELSSFSRLDNYEIKYVDDFDKAPVLTYTFTAGSFLTAAGNLRIVPVFDEMRLDHKLVAKEGRIFPVDFSGLSTKEAKTTVILPRNLRIKHLPANITLDNDWFIFISSYESDEKKIVQRQKITIKERFVPVGEYKDFKRELEKAFYFLEEKIVLEEND